VNAFLSLIRGVHPLLLWPLASFHTAALVLSGVVYLWVIDDLRGLFGGSSGFGAVIGLFAFAALWFSGLIGTANALPAKLPERIRLMEVLDLTMRGALGGVISGIGFIVIAALFSTATIVVSAAVAADPRQLVLVPLAVVIWGLAAVVAGCVGGFVGFFAGVVDVLIYVLALWIVGPLPQAIPNSETPAT
jgi:hypothetical protein